MNGMCPDGCPYGLPDAVTRPERSVGESNLASNCLPSLRAAAALDLGEHVVCIGHTEIGCASCDGWQRGRSIKRCDQLICERCEIGAHHSACPADEDAEMLLGRMQVQDQAHDVVGTAVQNDAVPSA